MSEPKDPISEAFADGHAMDQAMRDGVQEALWRHKCLGESIVVWENGKIVWLSADEIPVTGPPPPLSNGHGK